MCDWGDTVEMLVPIPGSLSDPGDLKWKKKPIDRCISDIVKALNNFGVYTAASCCSHGAGDGHIVLHDGRELTITTGEKHDSQ